MNVFIWFTALWIVAHHVDCSADCPVSVSRRNHASAAPASDHVTEWRQVRRTCPRTSYVRDAYHWQ